MTTYNITNSAGTVVATLNTSQTTGQTFPVELMGLGVRPYEVIAAQNWYRLCEHFATAEAPSNPIPGMIWFDTTSKAPNYYDGRTFVPFLTGGSASGGLFNMLSAARAIDLTVVARTTIFEAPGRGRFFPTGLLLVPTTGKTPAATSPAVLNLSVSRAEDVMEDVMVTNITRQTHAYYRIEGTTRFLRGTDTLRLNVTTGAAGGTLVMDAFVFGFTK